ncbi:MULTISPECIES: RNA polymerase sigma factor [Paenibacillus]|uniref:ECF RNA polymerase sigma factor SigW n=1 Tax=Paenibacillus albilobatus TaxID=2716884 RepID=A0A919XC10_9BACL|nr:MULTISPECIES: sigma-70 family RNA polymerase sigma factor [Paenibacillus]GIO29704.1 ECF RNA polymerase sigma factor SigW [Paenibacillus albilobatus]
MGLQNISEEQARLIYNSYSPYVYGIALMLTRSAPMADDIMQETFLRAFQKYDQYDPSRPLKPWLYRIAVNFAKSAMRRQKWLFFQADPPDIGDEFLVEESMMKSESERELWESVNKLSAKRKEVIILHYYAELSLPEVAEALNIPEGTCKSRLHEALKQLRRSHGPGWPGVRCKEEME